MEKMEKIKRHIDHLEQEIEEKFYYISKRVIELEDKLKYSEIEKIKIKRALRFILKKLESDGDK